jgi:inner membrane transporter RhtA
LGLAIERIGLGTAVTLEFLGPLVIALRGSLTALSSGAGRRVTLACAGIAMVGMLLLVRPEPTTDYLGVGLALVAAACWAIYILLNRAVGHRFVGVQGSAAAGTVSALLYIPIGAVVLFNHPPTLLALACGVAAGVLASEVPFVADLAALRCVPTHVFGIVTSVNPVFAAAIGALVLGDRLGADDWAAIGLIVAANAGQPSPVTLNLSNPTRQHRCRADDPGIVAPCWWRSRRRNTDTVLAEVLAGSLLGPSAVLTHPRTGCFVVDHR